MGGEVATLATEITPYVSAAVGAYGGAVLVKAREEAADATVGLGRRLLQRIFGSRGVGEPLPESVADVVSDPEDEDAIAALRLAIRKALMGDQELLTDIERMLISAQGRITAVGNRSVAGHTIGIAVTGDNTTIGW